MGPQLGENVRKKTTKAECSGKGIGKAEVAAPWHRFKRWEAEEGD